MIDIEKNHTQFVIVIVFFAACFGFEGADHTIDNSSRGYNINLGASSGWEFVAVYSENGDFQNMANNPVASNLGGNVTVGDIVGVAFDLENNKFYAHKNGDCTGVFARDIAARIVRIIGASTEDRRPLSKTQIMRVLNRDCVV